MNRVASSTTTTATNSGNASPNSSSPIVIQDSQIPGHQSKVIMRNKSNSGPSSPNGVPGVAVSLLAAATAAGSQSPAAAAAAKKPDEPEEEIDDFAEEEDHFQAETYADYMPLKLKIGVKHPDPVVETASLSSVHPPNVWYRLAIGEDVIDSGKLSALQLEAITYACQQHEQFLKDGSRAGFLLGDGAGVGKVSKWDCLFCCWIKLWS